ncbi:hypothetical protein JCM10450v2_003835 [Rhodotorula kratochvilovae]
MDRLSLLATAVTSPEHSMHHPLAGVGHPGGGPFSSAAAPLHPPGGGAYSAWGQSLASQSPNSPDSIPPYDHNAHQGYGGGGGAGGATGQLGRKKAARRASQPGEDDGDAGGHDADGQPARKKAKQSLSCGECKRRKIKCDRKIPCSSCLKRGDADACNWEDAKIEPEKQPFALATEVDEMRARLSLLERFINKLPPPLKTSFKELGITHMGELPKGDLKKEDMAGLDFAQFESMSVEQPGRRVPPPDSLGVMDNIIFDGLKHRGAVDGLQEPEKRDLTRMLTSIVAPRVVYTGPSLSTNLGLDPCFSQEELDSERIRLLDKIYRQLPDKKESKEAVDRYFCQFDWFFSILHHDTWWAEYERFWEMVEGGRKFEVDPAWLAMYCFILALSSDESMHLACPSTPEATSAWEDQSAKYQACAQKLIMLADPFGRPQARLVQITTFFACWTLISAHGGEFGRFSSWLACGIRVAQKMGLHQLTDDPENMPPDDPAWPPGKNALKRETALRIWGFLCFFDHLSASARFKAYMIHPSHTTTPPLSNVNWNQLSPTEWRIAPSPRSDASLEYHKLMMARVSRKTFDLLIAGSDTFNYGTILELDKDYRDLLDGLPDVWQQEYASLELKDPVVRNKRYLAMQGAHNRLVRLHRPFLVKGWEPNSKFAYSTDACIRSAKVVLLSHHNNLDINRNLRMMYSHTLSAAIVLFADLYHAIDIDAPDAEIESKKETLALSLEVFAKDIQDKVASRHLRVIIEAARRVLTGLFAEQAQRRLRIAARRASGDTSTSERSFAEILQSFAREIDGTPTAPGGTPLMIPGCQAGHYEIPSLSAAAASTSRATAALPQQQYQPDLSAWNPGPATALSGVSLPSDHGGTFSNNLLADMGLINLGGQTWDYWTQGGASGNVSTGLPTPAGGGAGGGGAGAEFAGGSGAELDLSAFLGVGAPANTQDAAQALLNQLTGGW